MKFAIETDRLAGFAAESTEGSQKIKVLVKTPFITSDDPTFYVYIIQISNMFLAKKGILSDFVYKLLIILHENNVADVYINDFREIIRAKVNKNIKKGEVVYIQNLTDITDLQFPDIKIQSTDAIIYCSKINWKFGLYFDFTRKINTTTLSKELGKLRKTLSFQNILDFTATEIKKSKYAFIVTEGKTDWQHLTKAHEKLKIGFKLDFDKYEGKKGDKDTLEMCKHYSRIPHKKPIIFIFDRDNPSIIKELKKKTKKACNYQDWENNVYSFLLPIPSHRKKYLNISIEFFYKDEKIRTKDRNGKRLFFDNELKKEILPGNMFKRLEIPPDKASEFNKKIDDQDVARIVDEEDKQIALSKSNFAANIIGDVKGFDNFDFSEFSKIFSIIEKIIKK